MQRRRKSTTSVSARTTRASRALQLDAVRRASRATLEHLENRQMLSISPTPGVTPGEGWSAAFYHDQGGGSTNPTAQDPLGDALAGNSAVPFAKKIDATIDFQGGQNGTMDGFPAFNNGANQSIRFDGYIQAPASGVMTFWSGSDDGVQVSINEGTDASPNWVTVTQRMKDARGTGTLGGGPYNEAVEVDTISAPGTNDTANSGPAFQFVAGHLYHVELAVQNGGGGWGAHLGWSGSAANLDGAAVGQIIPQSSVYLPAPSAPANVLATPVTGGGIQLTWSGGFGQTSTGPGGAATSYVVESSTNGTTWSAVGGPVTAANHADPIAYSVVDPAGTTATLYRVTASNDMGSSTPELAGKVNATVAGTGDGWSAAFFHDQGGGSGNATALDPLNDAIGGNVSTPAAIKIDSTIDFQGNQNATMDGFPGFNNGANQSIRFDGYLKAPASGVMTFWTGSDDGVQVSINEGTDTAPNWVTVVQKMNTPRGTGTLGTPAGPYNEATEVDTISAPVSNGTTNSGPAFNFVAGQLYHVVFDVENGGGGWGGHFGWSGPAANLPGATGGTIIPKSNVFAITPTEPATINTASGGGVVVVTFTEGQGSLVGASGAPTGYQILRSTDGGAFTPIGTVAGNSNSYPQAAFTYTDSTGTPGHNYLYAVAGTTAYATSSQLRTTVAVQVSPVLAVPMQITAVRNTDPTTVTVGWGAITGATGYDVKRATSVDASGHLVGATDLGVKTGTSFTDTGLGATTDYYYTVQAQSTVPGTVNSADSAVVFVGHGDGFLASYYGFRDGINHHTVDDANALLGFQRVDAGPINYGANNHPSGDNVGPNNYPAQWIAQGTNQVIANPLTGAGDNFGARWVAYVEAPVTGYYTFGAASDDGNNVVVYDSTGVPVTLQVNNIGANRGVPGTPDPAVVKDHNGLQYQFIAGQKYLVQYEFNNGGGGWGANLYWSASSTASNGANSDVMNQRLVAGYDSVVPTPAFVTLDANNPSGTGLVKDQGFYALKTAVNGGAASTSGVIQIDWNNIGADSYNVYLLDNTANPGGTAVKITGTPIAATAGAPLSYQLTGLTLGDSYTVYVTGISQSGETTLVNAAQATVTPVGNQAPATATGLQVVFDQWGAQNLDPSPANNSITLGTADTARLLVSWTPIPFATGYGVTPYLDGVAQPPIILGNVTSTFFAGALGHAWTFTVQGTNASGTSPVGALSNSVTVPVTGTAVEGYYSNQWWYANGFTNPGYNNVGTPDNLTVQRGVNFNSGDQNQPNPGSTAVDRQPGGRLGTNYSTVFEGSVVIPVTGLYTFGSFSDDQSALIIDGNVVAIQTGCCANVMAQFATHYNAGDKVSFIYFQSEGGGGHNTDLLWAYTPDDSGVTPVAVQTVPASAFLLIDQGVGVLPGGLPGKPTDLSGTQDAPNSGKIDISFTDNATNELHFTLMRSTNAAMTGAIQVATSNFLASTGAPGSIQDASGTNSSGVTYYYQVLATNLYGSTASAVIPISGTFINAPTFFSANPGNNLETVIQWINASASAGTNVVIESSPDGNTWTTLAQPAVNGTGLRQVYRISGGTAGVETFYRIHAVNGANISDYSATEGVLPVAIPGPAISAIDYSAGFTPNTLVVNTNNIPSPAFTTSGQLQLTDGGGGEARSVWTPNKVAVSSFTTTFDYTANAAVDLADGFTFTLQGDPRGTAALGGGGGSKGVGPDPKIINSISIGLNPYNHISHGVLYVNGTLSGDLDLAPSGINLHSGDTFEFVINYDGTNLTATITDVTDLNHPSFTIDAATFQGAVDTALGVPTTTPINIPGIVGGPTAYAGFTGATGGVPEVQNISNWTYGTAAVVAVGPTVAAFTVPSSVEGTAFASTAVNFTGQAGDTFSATVNYGDGSTPSVIGGLTAAGGNGTFNISHAYAEEGTYTVSVVVTDTTTSTASNPATTATATVTGAPLVASITGAPAGSIAPGTAVNLNFVVTQPNALEADQGTPSWTITGPAGFTTLTGTSTTTSFSPTIAGTYHVTMTASEAGTTDAETGTATPVDIVVSSAAAPTLVSRTIDDGNNQRSVIRSLTFTFSGPVTLGAGAITLNQVQNLSGATGVDASAALGTPVTTDGGITWKIPILATSAFSTLGSLIDGVYQTTVHASLVTDGSSQHMAADNTGLKFHRLFGDINGDKKVNATDYLRFSSAFGSTSTSTSYVVYFDYNHDGRINATDYLQFSPRFGKSFIYTG